MKGPLLGIDCWTSIFIASASFLLYWVSLFEDWAFLPSVFFLLVEELLEVLLEAISKTCLSTCNRRHSARDTGALLNCSDCRLIKTIQTPPTNTPPLPDFKPWRTTYEIGNYWSTSIVIKCRLCFTKSPSLVYRCYSKKDTTIWKCQNLPEKCMAIRTLCWTASGWPYICQGNFGVFRSLYVSKKLAW